MSLNLSTLKVTSVFIPYFGKQSKAIRISVREGTD